MNKPVITVANLKKIYPLPKAQNGKKTFEAVKGVNFNVYSGEIFGILGPNGAGKTTALEIIEGIKQQTSGSVNVLGFDNIKQADEIKKRIGIQLQSSQYLHHLSLGELLDLFESLYSTRDAIPEAQSASDELSGIQSKHGSGSRIFSGPNNTKPENSGMDTKYKLLRLVGLEDKEHEEFENLSGGQKQRFTIATSLVHNPEILFLDEPTTGLDPRARHDMWQLVKKLNADGITIVLTTHYMEEAEFLCHRVAIMDQGQILEISEPKKLIEKLSDTIQVSFFTDNEIDQNIFANLTEVKKIHDSYPKVMLEFASLDHISGVVNLLRQNQISFYGFTVKTASLEDVYLKLTGREFEE